MTSTFIKNSAEGLIMPITKLFNTSMESGIIPSDWKYANVTPVFKKGSKQDCGNYRPISLTCQMSKLMKRIIKDELMKFLEVNNIMRNSQHGFRNRKSCLTNLLEFNQKLRYKIDKGEQRDLILLDLQKAFDKVPHNKLLLKLENIGVKGKIWMWIKEWLSHRKQKVVLQGVESDWAEVFSGVP